ERAEVPERFLPLRHRARLAAHFRVQRGSARHDARRIRHGYRTQPAFPRDERARKVARQVPRQGYALDLATHRVAAATGSHNGTDARFERANPHLVAHIARFAAIRLTLLIAHAQVAP